MLLRVPPRPSEVPPLPTPEIPFQPDLPTTRPDQAPLPHPSEVPDRPREVEPRRE